jgi:hypothetical protein
MVAMSGRRVLGPIPKDQTAGVASTSTALSPKLRLIGPLFSARGQPAVRLDMSTPDAEAYDVVRAISKPPHRWCLTCWSLRVDHVVPILRTSPATLCL